MLAARARGLASAWTKIDLQFEEETAAILGINHAEVQLQLWAQAAELDTATLFGGFRIDPVTGAQVKHEAALVRWTSGGLTLA